MKLLECSGNGTIAESHRFSMLSFAARQMTEEDLNRIEAKLAIRLPDSYRHVMLDYPFPGGVSALLCDDASELVARNAKLRAKGFFRGRRWPNHLFAIDCDDDADAYFINLQGGDETIYFADHESAFDPEALESVDERYDTIQAYIEYVATAEEEIQADEEVPADSPVSSQTLKKWWQFWK